MFLLLNGVVLFIGVLLGVLVLVLVLVTALQTLGEVKNTLGMAPLIDNESY